MKYNMFLAPGDSIIVEFADGSPHEVIIKSHVDNLVEVSHMSDANRGEERLTYWFTPNENPSLNTNV
jgi:hypothetical protein